MYIRQMSKNTYDRFLRNLEAGVRRDPLDITYPIDLRVNEIHYHLRLFAANHRELVPLQAVRLDPNLQKCRRIAEPLLLGALTELVVAQYAEPETGAHW